MLVGLPRNLVSSLQFRLVLGFMLILGTALVAVGVFIGLTTRMQTERFESDHDRALTGRVSNYITNHYVEQDSSSEPGPDLQSIVAQAADISGLQLTVFDSQGNILADSDAGSSPNHLVNTERPGGSDDPDRAGWDPEAVGNGQAVPLIHGGELLGSLAASSQAPTEPAPDHLVLADPEASRISELVNRYLLLAGIGAAILGTGLTWALSRRTLAPLQSLGEKARRLGGGDLSQRAGTTGPSEIRELAQSFNAMAAELQEAERRRRRLTADIAHELRTPISNIQGYVEAIKDGVFPPTPETVDVLHRQTLLLARLVEDLRLLAQVNAGGLELLRAPTPVAALLQSCVAAVRARAEAEGVELSLETDTDLPKLDLDAARIAQVLGNLLDNALTHASEGGKVAVSARALADSVEVAVADSGPGIAPADLPRVFDRFYRADPSRSRATGGTGLGLAVARGLVESHGGSIEARSQSGRGSRFVIRLPVGRPREGPDRASIDATAE